MSHLSKMIHQLYKQLLLAYRDCFFVIREGLNNEEWKVRSWSAELLMKHLGKDKHFTEQLNESFQLKQTSMDSTKSLDDSPLNILFEFHSENLKTNYKDE